MKTIQIPGSGIEGKGKRSDCVNFGDDFHICFTKDGTFCRDSVGDQFSPALPSGSVQPGLTGPFTAPSQNEEMLWVFQGNSSSAVSGTLEIEPGNGCMDSSVPSCP